MSPAEGPRFDGSRLRDARKRAGLSQAALAELTKVPLSTIKRLEAGLNEPLAGRAYALAQALNTSVEALIADQDKEDR